MVYDLSPRPQNTSQIDLCSTVPRLRHALELGMYKKYSFLQHKSRPRKYFKINFDWRSCWEVSKVAWNPKWSLRLNDDKQNGFNKDCCINRIFAHFFMWPFLGNILHKNVLLEFATSGAIRKPDFEVHRGNFKLIDHVTSLITPCKDSISTI